MFNNKGYNSFNSFNKNNKPVVRRATPAPLEPGAIPSIGQYASKKEAEELGELNKLFNLFPKDQKMRRAAEKKLKQMNSEEDLSI